MFRKTKRIKFSDWTDEWWLHAFCYNKPIWSKRLDAAFTYRLSKLNKSILWTTNDDFKSAVETKDFPLIDFIRGMQRPGIGGYLDETPETE